MSVEKLGPNPREILSDSDLEKLKDGSEDTKEVQGTQQEEDPLTRPRPSEYLTPAGIEAIQGKQEKEPTITEAAEDITRASQEAVEGTGQSQSTELEKEEDSSDETLE